MHILQHIQSCYDDVHPFRENVYAYSTYKQKPVRDVFSYCHYLKHISIAHSREMCIKWITNFSVGVTRLYII